MKMSRDKAIELLECIKFDVAPKTQKALVKAIDDMNKLKTVKMLLEEMCEKYDSDFDKTLAECLEVLSE